MTEPKWFNYVSERTKGRATIQITPSGTLKAYVKKHGKVETKTVKDTKEEADVLIEWVDEVHGALLRTGMPPTWQLNKKYTIKAVCQKYLEECDPSLQDRLALQRLIDHPFGSLPLSDHRLVNAAHNFLNERLKTGTFQGKGWKQPKPIKASTVKREFNLYNAMFNKARREQWWGLHNISNPFEGYQFGGPTDVARERRLEAGELEKIEEAFKGLRGLNRLYVPLAFYLTIETGMHQQEVFNLRWKDVQLGRRRIFIRKHKSDQKTGRNGIWIVMPLVAKHLLECLQMRLDEMKDKAAEDADVGHGPFKNNHLIFPPVAPKTGEQAETYQGAFSNAFDGVLERSHINDGVENRQDRLCFADLRHEAANRMRKAGLLEEERALMLGHSDKKNMPRRYAHDKQELMEDIQNRLDRFLLNGKTENELPFPEIEKRLPDSIQEFIREHEDQFRRSLRIKEQEQAQLEAIANHRAHAIAIGRIGHARQTGNEELLAEATEDYEQAMEKKREAFRPKKLSECKLTPATVRELKRIYLEKTTLGWLEKYWYHFIAMSRPNREAANEIRHLLMTLGFNLPTVEAMVEEREFQRQLRLEKDRARGR